MKRESTWDAELELSRSETNLILVSAFKYINELLQAGIINRDEFDYGKEVMLTYNGKRRMDDYKESFLDAIPLLYNSFKNGIISERSYHDAVHQTIGLKKEKFLAQLINARLISYHDYKHSDHSSTVNLINDDMPSFGKSTPAWTAIMLTEKYGFRTDTSNINSLFQRIIMKKGSNTYTLLQRKGLFGKKYTITDENNKVYSYPELLKKLTADYGTL